MWKLAKLVREQAKLITLFAASLELALGHTRQLASHSVLGMVLLAA